LTEGNLTVIVDSSTPPALRGPDARHISDRFWIVTAAVLLVVFAIIIVVSFISAFNDNARVDRMKNHGIPVLVTVTSCVGNIGGSGSNAAGYTCRGSYRVDGVRYVEVIGSKSTQSNAGAKVHGVVDPSRRSTVELTSAVRASTSSLSVYVVPSLLAVLFVIAAIALGRRRRRRRSTTSRATHEPSSEIRSHGA
jgi:heme/copper-type cytochrome/quinol oxidase subunit 2